MINLNQHTLMDAIYNPIFKDTCTFVKTSAETQGEYSELEITLGPLGGNPLHKHTAFCETFTVLEGQLGVSLQGMDRILLPGESVTVEPGDIHRFFNPTNEDVTFRLLFTPGHTGAENMLRILYGLARDGETNKNGIPKSIVHLALCGEMGNSKLPGILSLISPLLKALAWYGKRNKVEQMLLEKYCRQKATVQKQASVL
ncbi:cupin domain-containing protein [Parachryseolinea silvisoli]|uniref:cupin domain-containing protein n=1 Tax=Parachryseolinea silvisoli TaxID=2873601 RepID=UPI0022657E77|nr:cupin domain-containing protein [Parachryseolinea silvisoli]MCD9018059.1 cupin domain-containing protein [Parachryseolinea silvisoli]